jgi:protocatechuate 3,4-dioxygenase beta subunit
MNPLLPVPRRQTLDQAPRTPPTVRLLKGAKRWALAVLLGCVALLALAPVAGAVTPGAISGTVTNEAAAAVQGIQVEVLNPVTHEFAGVAFTDASGKFTVASVAPGSYKVEFVDSSKTYAPQFYKEKSSFSAAELVAVVEATTTLNINAKLHAGGSVNGTVTDTHGNALTNVFVNVINEEGEFAGGSATDSLGKYTVTGLAKGSFKVGFSLEEGVNFVAQYYNGKSSFSEADKVLVVEGATTEHIDAKLQEGGRISGTVTDAVTHRPLANVFVSAFEPSKIAFGSAVTNAAGEYTIVGLSTGSYTVEFEQFTETEAGSEYINQSRTGIGVAQGNTTSGINVALVPRKPSNTSAAVASGTPTVGQTLSCSNGSWSGIATITYAYKWLRDGSAIAGATGSTYVVQATDQAHGLACEVTATNPAGHASATSNTLKVAAPPPPPPPPPPTLSGAGLTNKRFRVANKDTAVVAKKAPRGTSFHLTLSEPSKVQIVITRSAPGLRRGHRCLAPTAKLKHAHAKRCTRTLTAGTLTRLHEPQGVSIVPFSGRIGHRPLQPGVYKATLKASNANGVAAPVVLTFIVVR